MKPTKPNSTFRYVFAAVLSLTLTSGGTALHLANQATLTDAQDRILDSAIAMWTMGTTTLIGLLSSRPNQSDDSDPNHGQE